MKCQQTVNQYIVILASHVIKSIFTIAVSLFYTATCPLVSGHSVLTVTRNLHQHRGLVYQ